MALIFTFKVFLAVVITFMTISEAKKKKKLLGMNFGSLETYLKTDGAVRHMEMDQAIPGNILYADDNCLRTTNGSVSILLFGNCTSPNDPNGGNNLWQGFLPGFTQLNTTHIVYLEQERHCLQILERNTGKSSRLVGDCQMEGAIRDGIDAKFSYPSSVKKSKHKLNSLIVVDWHNRAIREVDLKTLNTTTLLTTDHHPRDFTYTADRVSLIITNDDSLSKYNLKSRTLVDLIKRGNVLKDGDLENAVLIHPREILTLSSRYLIVSQYIDGGGKSRLRLVDLQEKQVASICTGVDGTLDGDIINCQLDRPLSLLRHQNIIYVGQKKAIRKLKVIEPLLPFLKWRIQTAKDN